MTPPHGNWQWWESREAKDATELIEELRDLGCHTTDIGDAMFEADPFWQEQLK